MIDKERGKETDEAPCPQCGDKPQQGSRYASWVVFILLVLAVIALVGVMSGPREAAKKDAASAPALTN